MTADIMKVVTRDFQNHILSIHHLSSKLGLSYRSYCTMHTSTCWRYWTGQNMWIAGELQAPPINGIVVW